MRVEFAADVHCYLSCAFKLRDEITTIQAT